MRGKPQTSRSTLISRHSIEVKPIRKKPSLTNSTFLYLENGSPEPRTPPSSRRERRDSTQSTPRRHLLVTYIITDT